MSLPLLELLPDSPPRRALGRFPSPVEAYPALSAALGAHSFQVKREDLNGPIFGGNKLRALEFLLPAVGSVAVTMGGYGSTWCAALATSLAPDGRAFPALFPQPWSDTVAGVLAATLRHGSVQLASTRARLPVAIWRAWREARAAGPPRWVPAGGANPTGVLGSINGALEFVRQVEAGEAERPDAIVVPFGSGGTAAGLLLGLWLAGWPTTLCAVRVTDPWFANRYRVMSLVRRTAELLRRQGLTVRPGPAALRIVGDQLGGGYGMPTRAAQAAMRVAAAASLALDGTYGAKAWAALESLAPSFPRLCFWHTFDARLASAPMLEHPLVRQARAYSESLWHHPKSI